MISAYAFPLLLAGLAWQPVIAAPLYKWVDNAGHVTYSSRPPPTGIPAVKVEAPPQPTAEQTRQAEERVKRTQEQASELESQRRKQEAREAEEARLRAQQTEPAVEQPVLIPQPWGGQGQLYYPPVMAPPRRNHDKPHRRPRRPPEPHP